MSTDELLKPRYKVISDYPGNIIPVGSIFWDDIESINIITPTGSKFIQSSYPYRHKDKFHHLFKKLEWWENRKPEEMPEYVKYNEGIYKVEKPLTIISGYIYTEGEVIEAPLKQTLPATAAEYEQYINQKEKQ